MVDITFQEVLGGVSAGIGICGFVWAMMESLAARASRHWPRIPATIIASSVQRQRGVDGPLHGAEIRYQYTAGAVEHTSDRVRFGGRWGYSWRTPSDRLVAQYPSGSTVQIAVDPSDPSRAVLEPGHIRNAVASAGLFVTFASLGTWLLLA
jgi:hypothetical protein